MQLGALNTVTELTLFQT